MESFLIDADTEGKQVIRLVQKIFSGAPQSVCYKLIRKGQVRLNGKRVKPGQRLLIDDVLTINPKLPIPPSTGPAPKFLNTKPPFESLYRDTHLWVLNKPRRLAVHGGTGTSDAHLTFWVRHSLGIPSEINTLLYSPSPVHRLDKDTTGCIVFALTLRAHRLLQKSLAAGLWKKEYLAWVHGILDETSGEIRIPLPRKRKSKCDQALTTFSVRTVEKNKSLLLIAIRTGRFRQIRRHFAKIGHPVVGDRRYPPFGKKTTAQQQLMLHAYKLSFPHPMTQEIISVEAPPPAYLNAD